MTQCYVSLQLFFSFLKIISTEFTPDFKESYSVRWHFLSTFASYRNLHTL